MPPETFERTCPAPDPVPRRPRHRLPAGATDCHAHVIGPAAAFPFVEDRSYTPPDALLPAYLHVLETLGFGRSVLVQPSMHGDDNTVMLRAMAEARGVEFRAVAVVSPDIADAELEQLHDAGVRGVRINLVYDGGGVGLDAASRIAERIAGMGWHIQFLADISRIGAGLTALERLPVPIVFDHLGHLPASAGTGDPGFSALAEMVKRGKTWVKLSGAYRVAEHDFPYPDARPFCEALLAASPARLVWGTDWPHTVCRHPMPNDGDLLDLFCDWVGSANLLKRILVDNPAELYGFQ